MQRQLWVTPPLAVGLRSVSQLPLANFVVEPNSDCLCWLYPEGNNENQVKDRITIADYLTILVRVANSMTIFSLHN